MNNITIRKAERKKSKLRLGIVGAAGSGKTYSALRLAHGLGKKVCLIDTERGSGDLYAHLFDYDIINLSAPNFAPIYYIEAIKAAEASGYDVIIIDSLSHAWTGEGGLLDQVDKMQGNKNSFTAWRDVTPQHNKLIDAMLSSSSHIIITMRTKTAYDMEEYTDNRGNKKTKPVKIGLAPVQREGMDYEFTVVFDVNDKHFAEASKDRTDMFKQGIFQITEKIGEQLLEWLNEGKVNYDELRLHIFNIGISKFGLKTDSTFVESVEKITGLKLVEKNFEKINEILRTKNYEKEANKYSGNSKKFNGDKEKVIGSGRSNEAVKGEKGGTASATIN